MCVNCCYLSAFKLTSSTLVVQMLEFYLVFSNFPIWYMTFKETVVFRCLIFMILEIWFCTALSGVVSLCRNV